MDKCHYCENVTHGYERRDEYGDGKMRDILMTYCDFHHHDQFRQDIRDIEEFDCQWYVPKNPVSLDPGDTGSSHQWKGR